MINKVYKHLKENKLLYGILLVFLILITLSISKAIESSRNGKALRKYQEKNLVLKKRILDLDKNILSSKVLIKDLENQSKELEKKQDTLIRYETIIKYKIKDIVTRNSFDADSNYKFFAGLEAINDSIPK